jgi:hypothetical protein
LLAPGLPPRPFFTLGDEALLALLPVSDGDALLARGAFSTSPPRTFLQFQTPSHTALVDGRQGQRQRDGGNAHRMMFMSRSLSDSRSAGNRVVFSVGCFIFLGSCFSVGSN